MNTIIGLILLGVVLVSFEVIMPGAILGILGASSFIGAIYLAYQDYGIFGGFVAFFSSIFLLAVALILEFKILPKTKFGKKMFLDTVVNAHSTEMQGSDAIIGKEGITITTLAPSGKIDIEGQEFEGFSQDGLINSGEKIKVVGRDNFRILVNKVKKE